MKINSNDINSIYNALINFDKKPNVISALSQDERAVVLEALKYISNSKIVPCKENEGKTSRMINGILTKLNQQSGDNVVPVKPKSLAKVKSIGKGIFNKLSLRISSNQIKKEYEKAALGFESKKKELHNLKDQKARLDTNIKEMDESIEYTKTSAPYYEDIVNFYKEILPVKDTDVRKERLKTKEEELTRQLKTFQNTIEEKKKNAVEELTTRLSELLKVIISHDPHTTNQTELINEIYTLIKEFKKELEEKKLTENMKSNDVNKYFSSMRKYLKEAIEAIEQIMNSSDFKGMEEEDRVIIKNLLEDLQNYYKNIDSVIDIESLLRKEILSPVASLAKYEDPNFKAYLQMVRQEIQNVNSGGRNQTSKPSSNQENQDLNKLLNQMTRKGLSKVKEFFNGLPEDKTSANRKIQKEKATIRKKLVKNSNDKDLDNFKKILELSEKKVQSFLRELELNISNASSYEGALAMGENQRDQLRRDRAAVEEKIAYLEKLVKENSEKHVS